VRSAILDSAVRPIVIVFPDPTSDRCSRFFQAPILRRPDFLFFQAAVEPFDVAVAFRVMIGRPPMGDASLPNVSRKREEVNCVPLSVVSVTFASRLPSGSRARTVCSTAASASSVRQRCERFQPTISRVQQSITHTRYAQPMAGPAQIFVMSDCQI
jgi:hypothetical protein